MLSNRPIRVALAATVTACLASLALLPSPAEAWGKKAHRLVAAVAESLLDDHTRNAVRALVGSRGLAGIATWADDIREARPETAPWHYVNIPLGDAAYDPETHCSSPTEGSCVVAALERYVERLSDHTAPREIRLEALKFVTHFVADIHQPLHCIAYARGGNDVPVEFRGEPWNLHAVWDAGLIHSTGLTHQAYHARLMKRLHSTSPGDPAPGSPADWAGESHRLAVDVALSLPRSGRIGPDYARAGLRVIDRQLVLAGSRLAGVLRAAFAHHGR